MKLILILAALALCGCETGHRSNDTRHTVEKWTVITNAAGNGHRFLVFRERWVDRSGVRFTGLLTDPSLTAWSDGETNQNALGGGYRISFGGATSKADAAGITAAGGAIGTAAGSIIGAALKAP